MNMNEPTHMIELDGRVPDILGSDGSTWLQDLRLVSFDRNTALMRYKSQHVAS